MNNKIILALLGISLLACNFLFSKIRALAPVPTLAPTIESELQPTGFTLVRLHPSDGKLQSLLAREAQNAVNLGQMPIVEFDATWCPPCQAIDAAIRSRNERMLAAYSGTYIIRLDVDEWGWGGSSLHDFQFDGIPVYFKLDAQGRQTGEVVDGGAWEEDIPENIAPVMDKFFHGD